jgi:SAM-dependent methyltransferase
MSLIAGCAGYALHWSQDDKQRSCPCALSGAPADLQLQSAVLYAHALSRDRNRHPLSVAPDRFACAAPACRRSRAVFWTCSSLLVSHYVYDRSTFYTLLWLHDCLSRSPARWINIHSGIDETSLAIASMFPNSEGQIADIYDQREMTEPSIERARRLAAATLAATDWRALPAPDQQFDTAFLIFAAHELRRHEARVRLFREIARVLRIGGELVLVEHSRDWANFLAFGPGFLHFFSARTWQNAANAVDLPIRLHRTVTPFVHVFVLRRQ